MQTAVRPRSRPGPAPTPLASTVQRVGALALVAGCALLAATHLLRRTPSFSDGTPGDHLRYAAFVQAPLVPVCLLCVVAAAMAGVRRSDGAVLLFLASLAIGTFSGLSIVAVPFAHAGSAPFLILATALVAASWVASVVAVALWPGRDGDPRFTWARRAPTLRRLGRTLLLAGLAVLWVALTRPMVDGFGFGEDRLVLFGAVLGLTVLAVVVVTCSFRFSGVAVCGALAADIALAFVPAEQPAARPLLWCALLLLWTAAAAGAVDTLTKQAAVPAVAPVSRSRRERRRAWWPAVFLWAVLVPVVWPYHAFGRDLFETVWNVACVGAWVGLGCVTAWCAREARGTSVSAALGWVLTAVVAVAAFGHAGVSPRFAIGDPASWFDQHRADFDAAVASSPPSGAYYGVHLPDALAYLSVDGTVAGPVDQPFFPQWIGFPDDAGGYIYSPRHAPDYFDMFGYLCSKPVDLGGGWWMCGMS